MIIQTQDCDISLIRHKVISILGFGSQGRSHAQNLRDSGAEVFIGLQKESKSIAPAKELGFKVMSVEEAVKKGELIVFMLPDELHQEVFQNQVAPYLNPSHTLVFCHGFSIHFKLIQPPKNVGVIMIAPKAQGKGVRDEFLKNSGAPALIAIHQENQQNNARKLALSYAAGIGSHKSLLIETTFEKEAQSDLFGEQAVLCGGLKGLIQNAFEVLVEAGFSQDLAFFECLHELKLVVDLLYQGGMESLHQNISNTAEYGMIISQDRIITPAVKKAMKELLQQIQSGDFAKDFLQEKEQGYPRIYKERERIANHLIEKTGKDLREKIFKSS